MLARPVQDVDIPDFSASSPYSSHLSLFSDDDSLMYPIKLEIEEFLDLDYVSPSAEAESSHDEGIPCTESPENLRSVSPQSDRSLSSLSTCLKDVSPEIDDGVGRKNVCPEPTCRRNFMRANALQRHISSIHGQSGVKCPFCLKAKRLFNRSDNFQRCLPSPVPDIWFRSGVPLADLAQDTLPADIKKLRPAMKSSMNH